MVCSECESNKVEMIWADHVFPYGSGDSQVSLVAKVPVFVCSQCGAKWLNYLADSIMEKVVEDYKRKQ